MSKMSSFSYSPERSWPLGEFSEERALPPELSTENQGEGLAVVQETSGTYTGFPLENESMFRDIEQMLQFSGLEPSTTFPVEFAQPADAELRVGQPTIGQDMAALVTAPEISSPVLSLPSHGAVVQADSSMNVSVQRGEGAAFLPLDIPVLQPFAAEGFENTIEPPASGMDSGIMVVIASQQPEQMNVRDFRPMSDEARWRMFLEHGEIEDLKECVRQLWVAIQTRMQRGYRASVNSLRRNMRVRKRAHSITPTNANAEAVAPYTGCIFGPQCSEPFTGSTPDELKRHALKFHNGNNLTCHWRFEPAGMLCGKPLKNAETLAKHILNVHFQAGACKCSGCGKQCSRSDALRRHERKCKALKKMNEAPQEHC